MGVFPGIIQPGNNSGAMYMNTWGLGKWQKRAQTHSQAEGWESAKTGHGIEWKGVHSQAPSCTLIHVAVRARAHASPLGTPAAADGPAEGYFVCANPSAAVLVAHWPPSGAHGPAFSCLSTTLPGPAFAPLSATGLGFLRGGKIPWDMY